MYYQAKLDNLSYWITVLSSALLLILPAGILYKAGSFEPILLLSLALLPLILLICFAYRVTGFDVSKRQILIKRIVGDFSIPVEEIDEIYFDQDAMKNSIRTFGNGGLFGFYGRFRNKTLGPYRAFVTSTKKAVVIKTKKQTFVLSPEKPEAFVRKVEAGLNNN